jgi:hypothetical protein
MTLIIIYSTPDFGFLPKKKKRSAKALRRTSVYKRNKAATKDGSIAKKLSEGNDE